MGLYVCMFNPSNVQYASFKVTETFNDTDNSEINGESHRIHVGIMVVIY